MMNILYKTILSFFAAVIAVAVIVLVALQNAQASSGTGAILHFALYATSAKNIRVVPLVPGSIPDFNTGVNLVASAPCEDDLSHIPQIVPLSRGHFITIWRNKQADIACYSRFEPNGNGGFTESHKGAWTGGVSSAWEEKGNTWSPLSAADLNGDQLDDLVIVRWYGRGTNKSIEYKVALGQSDGSFDFNGTPTTFISAAWTGFYTLADVDGDGHADIVFHRFRHGGRHSTVLYMLRGRGDGTFAATANKRFLLSTGVRRGSDTAVVADFNADGLPDVFLPPDDDVADEGQAHIAFGKGGGTLGTIVESIDFVPSREGWTADTFSASAQAYDVNLDDHLDIIANENQLGVLQTKKVYWGNGSGQFSTVGEELFFAPKGSLYPRIAWLSVPVASKVPGGTLPSEGTLPLQMIITTVTGNGKGGYRGDGGQVMVAQLHSPMGVAVDSQGNLYIADSENHRIRKVNRSGIITTIAGNGEAGYSGDGGSATEAKLRYPMDVIVDSQGNLYIADSHNDRVRKVDTSGIITTIAGSEKSGYSGDEGRATAAQLNYPTGVAVDSQGNLYIVDSETHRIRKVDISGIITTIAGNGKSGYGGDGGPATEARLGPLGVAVDSQGNLYIADSHSDRIRKVDTSGMITTIAGNGKAGSNGDGGRATDAKLNYPTGVAIDSQGNLYIADHLNHRIRKVDATGIITTFAGNGKRGYGGDGGSATEAKLRYPMDVAIDSQGKLYIADSENHRIRAIHLPRMTMGRENVGDTTIVLSECVINLENNTHNCPENSAMSFVRRPGNRQTVIKINLHPRRYTKAVFEVFYGKKPNGWTINIGDSRSNNGWGGDGGHQSHDAEMQINGTSMAVYGSDYTLSDRRYLLDVANIVGQGETITLEVSHQHLGWNSPKAADEFNSPYLYALDGQADREGPVNYDIYAAFNRVISSAGRRGSGVTQVRIRLLK